MAEETIIHVFWERVKTTPNRIAMMQKTGGAFTNISWAEEGKIVAEIGAALLSLDIESAQQIAIISHSRPQWTWADLSILSVGAVTVPVYPSLNSTETAYILDHSEVKVAFLENPRQLKKIASIPSLPSNLTCLVLFEGHSKELNEEISLPVYSLEEFRELGKRKLEAQPDCVEQQLAKITPESLATIVYTSGTTGVPKGAMIKHSNIYYVCKTLSVNVGFHPDDLGLSFLPLSHIFERVGGQFLLIYEGIALAYAESMESVAGDIGEVRPTIMNAVPRFYEKAYNKIQAQIRQLPTPQQYFARWALSLARRALKAKEEHRNADGSDDLSQKLYRTELRIADRFVFRKIRSRFGGRLRFLVSGAAPLSPEVHIFFESIGLPILEGYGLTETTAPVACNRPATNRRGTVGKPLPGQEVKIASDGEIMVRGPNIFSGYYKNEEATEAAFSSDGWFLTGDIGELDADGFLTIKDRKKDIIITANGKHVAPQVLENMLAGQGIISRVLVYGDRRKYISALITLSPDDLKSFAKSQGIDGKLSELIKNPQVQAQVQSLINDANAKLASFEQIKKFIILEDDFTMEANELTPTLKLRRKFVTEKYQSTLDSLYEREDLEVEKSRQ